MRLMRKVLGENYDRDNGLLREAGRKLSPVRDAQALIEVFDQLNDHYRDKLAGRNRTGVREQLVRRRKALIADFRRKRVLGAVLKSLRAAAERAAAWDLKDGEVGDLLSGFVRTIRENRKAARSAYNDAGPDAFHEWRKRAKDLRYHLALLGKAWPPVLDGYEAAAKELEAKLGDDHNLVVLRNTILESPGDFGRKEEIQAFLDVVDHQLQKLRSEAKTLAERLYAEKPRQWRRRIELCWSAWKEEKAG